MWEKVEDSVNLPVVVASLLEDFLQELQLGMKAVITEISGSLQ
jgi:thymidine kinase